MYWKRTTQLFKELDIKRDVLQSLFKMGCVVKYIFNVLITYLIARSSSKTPILVFPMEI